MRLQKKLYSFLKIICRNHLVLLWKSSYNSQKEPALRENSTNSIINMLSTSKNYIHKISHIILLVLGIFVPSKASSKPDKENPVKVYVIKDIKIQGAKYIDEEVLLQLSGLKVGGVITLPGDQIREAINNIWKHKIVNDIRIEADKITKDSISLLIIVEDNKRIVDYEFKGLSDSDEESILSQTGELRGMCMTKTLTKNIKDIINKTLEKNSYIQNTVEIEEQPDEKIENGVSLKIKVKKNNSNKVHKIYIKGNNRVDHKRLKNIMLKTKERGRPPIIRKVINNVFSLKTYTTIKGKSLKMSEVKDMIQSKMLNLFGTKYKEDDFLQDRKKLLDDAYYSKGYLDAKIISYEVLPYDDQGVDIYMDIYEGEKYKIGKIRWIGNKIFDSKTLQEVLGMNSGDIYNKVMLDNKLLIDPMNSVQALYRNHGYLFSTITLRRAKVSDDNVVDLDILITEGEQATIDKVIITGHKITKDHILRRFITTLPGQKYSNVEILRSRQYLVKSGFVDPHKTQIHPLPNPENNTTDIEYIIREKLDFKFSLKGGYSVYGWHVGASIGLNNFSLRNLCTLGIPLGDGQSVDFSWELNKAMNSFNLVFMDPWIGGARPLFLKTSFNYMKQKSLSEDNEEGQISTKGVGFSLGKKIKWPDETTIHGGLKYNNHYFKKYVIIEDYDEQTGYTNDLIFDVGLERDTTDSLFYPTKGNKEYILGHLTPPWSHMTGKNPDKLIQLWSEFHQWKFGASIFQKIIGKLVIFGNAECGLLGGYGNTGVGKYRRFFMGGDGVMLGTYNHILGQSSVKLRGYPNPNEYEFGIPISENGHQGGVFYNKYTIELRHPIKLDFIIPMYVQVFFEAGNLWADYNKIHIKEIVDYKSYGFGIRAVLPMIGPIGLDFGFGIDRENKNLNPEVHFAMGL